MGTLSWAAGAILIPSEAGHVAIFYLFWISLFFMAHVVWDACSGRTGKFHISCLGQKTNVLYSAATFASSLLLVIGLLNKPSMVVAGDIQLPIVLAGLSGIFSSFSQLCPYDASSIKSASEN